MSDSRIWLSSPHIGGKEITFIQEAFDDNLVTSLGTNIDVFEKQLQEYVFRGEKAVTALNSGTAALHMGLVLLDVKAGDEVICQSATYCATANAITYRGATPVFIDSELDTWNMSPVFLEQAIKEGIAKGKKPKAIIPVHLYGMPAKMDEIMAMAGKYEIPVIEDAAEALGSHINGKMCGSFGEIAALSFNGNKIITTSGGGALVGSEAYAAKARFLSTQARDAAPHYQHSEIGYNYRMSNICAGIGRGQMEVLNERVQQRRANYERYYKELSSMPGIRFVAEPEGYYSNRWLTTVLIDPEKTGGITREDIRLALEKDNIESRPLWKPMHLQPVFAGCAFYGDGTSGRLFEQGLCLPSGSNLTDSDFERIFNVLHAIFAGQLA